MSSGNPDRKVGASLLEGEFACARVYQNVMPPSQVDFFKFP